MNKALGWIGAAVIALGVALGFVKSGACGSVFQPVDDTARSVDQLLGQKVADCSTATDLTPFVWGLLVIGAVMVIVGVLTAVNSGAAVSDQADVSQSGDE